MSRKLDHLQSEHRIGVEANPQTVVGAGNMQKKSISHLAGVAAKTGSFSFPRSRFKFPTTGPGITMKTITRKTISLLTLALLLGLTADLRAAVFAKANWVGLGSGLGGTVSALAVDTNGNLYAGGVFTNAGTLSVNHIAEWNGTAWSALGSPSNGVNGQVLALAVDTNRNILYVGGTFSTAGGVAASNIAKWNGNSWTNLGSGMNGQVNALAVDTNGNLFAGGSFTTPGTNTSKNGAIWNGTNWCLPAPNSLIVLSLQL